MFVNDTPVPGWERAKHIPMLLRSEPHPGTGVLCSRTELRQKLLYES